jgi:hypothetical protein
MRSLASTRRAARRQRLIRPSGKHGSVRKTPDAPLAHGAEPGAASDAGVTSRASTESCWLETRADARASREPTPPSLRLQIRGVAAPAPCW